MAYWHSNLQQYIRDSDSDDGTYGASSKIVTPRRVPGMPFNPPEPDPSTTPQIDNNGRFLSPTWEVDWANNGQPAFTVGLLESGLEWVVGTTTPNTSLNNALIQKVPPVRAEKDENEIALTFLPPTCAVPTSTLGTYAPIRPLPSTFGEQPYGCPYGNKEPCYFLEPESDTATDYFFTLPIWIPQSAIPIILWFFTPDTDPPEVSCINATSDTTLVSQSSETTQNAYTLTWIQRLTLNYTFTQTPGTKLELKIKLSNPYINTYFCAIQAPFYANRAFHLKKFPDPITNEDGFEVSTLNSTTSYAVVDFTVPNNDGWFSNVIGKGNFYMSGGGEVNGPRTTTDYNGVVHRNYAVGYSVVRNAGDIKLVGVNLITQAV